MLRDEVSKKKVLVTIMAMGVISFAASLLCADHTKKMFYVNVSGSLPAGLYRAITVVDRRVGDLVVFEVPEKAKAVVYGRKMLPEGWPLIKRIAGLGGDTFCVRDGTLYVNEKYVAPVFECDSHGEPLAHVDGCHTVGADEFLPVSTYIPHSYDGRYFGSVPLSSIKARAAPVWTF